METHCRAKGEHSFELFRLQRPWQLWYSADVNRHNHEEELPNAGKIRETKKLRHQADLSRFGCVGLSVLGRALPYQQRLFLFPFVALFLAIVLYDICCWLLCSML